MPPLILDWGIRWQGLGRGLHVYGKGQEGVQEQGKQDQVATVTRSTQHTLPVYGRKKKNPFSMSQGF